MKKQILITCALLLGAGTLIAQQTAFPKLTGPYLGQKPPGMTPEIFAPGIVSIPNSAEFSGTFSPDGSEYYFYRISKNDPDKIFFSKLKDGKWTAPASAAFAEGYPANVPAILFDNKTLFFAWERPNLPEEKGIPGVPGMWLTTRTENGWSIPKYAGQGMWISSSRDGQIYITDLSWQSGGPLAKVTLKNGRLTGYKKLSGGMDALLDKEDMAHPCIDPEGSFLLFDVYSGSYLYVCFRMSDGTWGDAIDLTQHGFDKEAGGAYVSPDGKYLFFHLKGDIWWVDIKVIEKLEPKESK